MVSATFASILRSGRSDFNDKFAAARRVYPDLQPEAFSDFLKTHVDALVASAANLDGDHVPDIVMIAYDAALALVGQKLAGPAARLPEINDAWRRIFPRIPAAVVSAPAKIIPAVSNAVYQLASTPNARPQHWIEKMERLGPECEDATTLLKVGQVLAWRAGLAHFRHSAILTADSLPKPLTLAALDCDAHLSWSQIRSQLMCSPWFDPAKPSAPAAGITIRVGSFRGFGGLFSTPPVVVSSGDHFIVRSKDECWLLTADVFGSTFHRTSLNEFEAAAAQSSLPQGILIDGATVSFSGNQIELPDPGYFTSAAANATTLAVTSPFSHSIVLAALK
jgi:hypothetical protein